MHYVGEAFGQSVGHWFGCDWKTSFGPRQSNLEGINSVQAAMLADATSGAEGENWRRASRWLAQVEQDAREAELLAHQALEAFQVDRLQLALDLANRACQIENRYRPPIVWASFRDAIALKLKFSRIKIPFLASSA